MLGLSVLLKRSLPARTYFVKKGAKLLLSSIVRGIAH